MRIIFFGTGNFGIPTVKRLINSEHDLLAVVTQPDKHSGRGWNMQAAPVKAFIEKAAPGMDVLQPVKVSETSFIDEMKALSADIFVVVDYGQLIPERLLNIPSGTCINLHPSLLPRYRGASPVNYAILNGDIEAGNTVIRMDAQMDSGDIVLQDEMLISEKETAPELHERLSQGGAELVLKAVELIESDEAIYEAQKDEEATYAPRLVKQDGLVDWKNSAVEIERQVRAMQPWPGAFTLWGGKTLKIFDSEIVCDVPAKASPGSVIDTTELIVATGEGSIRIKNLQIEGKKRMSATEFLRGYSIDEETVLGDE